MLYADQQLHGKTSLSISLAQKIDGEIVSCDSMQIYKDMNIGTATPTQEEMRGIKHYMINCVDPEERFSVSDYKRQAEKSIEEILKKDKIPIVVGGTGLYLNSLVDEIEYPEIGIDEDYRIKLNNRAEKEGLGKLYDEAYQIDPEAMEKISQNDKKRIIRVLEIYYQTGKTKTQQEILSRKNEVRFDYYIFGLNMERTVLYERINKRVDIMIEQGLIEEVKELVKKHPKIKTAMQSIGYKETVEYLENKMTKEEMIEKIKQESRRYAKRQLTWFRKRNEMIWLNGLESHEENIRIILETIKKEKCKEV